MDIGQVDLGAGREGRARAVPVAEPVRGYWQRMRAAAEHLAGSVHDPVPTILDLGCGSGLSTRELLRATRRRGLTARIIGIDPSPAMVELARARRWPQGVDFVAGDAATLSALGLPRAHAALAHDPLRNLPGLDAALPGLPTTLFSGATLVATADRLTDLDVIAGWFADAGFESVRSCAVGGWRRDLVYLVEGRV